VETGKPKEARSYEIRFTLHVRSAGKLFLPEPGTVAAIDGPQPVVAVSYTHLTLPTSDLV